MKSFTLFAASLALLASFAKATPQASEAFQVVLEEQEGCQPRGGNNCPQPCNIKPETCGLGRCECPDKCSALWFGSCDGSSGAYCQDYFLDCNIQCNQPNPSVDSSFVLTGACIAFESFDRPLCYMPQQSTVWGDCPDPTSIVTIRNGAFYCVINRPDLFVKGCYKNGCPKGYYPTCLLVANYPFFSIANGE